MGPVIQASERLNFEDDLKICFTLFYSEPASTPSWLTNIGRSNFFAGEMITPATELGTLLKVIGIASLSGASQSSILSNHTKYVLQLQTNKTMVRQLLSQLAEKTQLFALVGHRR